MWALRYYSRAVPKGRYFDGTFPHTRRPGGRTKTARVRALRQGALQRGGTKRKIGEIKRSGARTWDPPIFHAAPPMSKQNNAHIVIHKKEQL